MAKLAVYIMNLYFIQQKKKYKLIYWVTFAICFYVFYVFFIKIVKRVYI